MYISPFWCGVIATIGTEILLIIAFEIYLSTGSKKKKKKEK